MAPPLATSTSWIHDGTAFFLDHAAEVDVAADSGLPGWTNGHVLTHVARNAEAIGRLLTWAGTGVETPMYDSAAARAADIERGAGRGREEQLRDVRDTAAALDDQLAATPESAWSAQVRMLSGRVLDGPDVAWLRVKELWLHAVDIGAQLTKLPPELIDALLHDVTMTFDGRADTPSLRLVVDDGAEFIVHDGAIEVRGAATELVGWLTGRSAGAQLRCADGLPALPNWA